jgi:hypothetical protein
MAVVLRKSCLGLGAEGEISAILTPFCSRKGLFCQQKSIKIDTVCDVIVLMIKELKAIFEIGSVSNHSPPILGE